MLDTEDLGDSSEEKQEYTLKSAGIKNGCIRQQRTSDVTLMVAAEELIAVSYGALFISLSSIVDTVSRN